MKLAPEPVPKGDKFSLQEWVVPHAVTLSEVFYRSLDTWKH
jgi:hypothetical protein